MVDSVTIKDPFIGNYLSSVRVERVIGRGGMAIVYGGVDETLNRRVAIKVISTAHQEKKAYAERFKKEAQLVATWDHPNIIQIYSAGEYDGSYYFIMRFIEGLDLRQLIDQYINDGQMVPIKDVLSIGRSVADALDYAHKRGVIHRDIKPSNVMISTEFKVLLMDFGLALDISQGSIGEIFGTPHYMAPEQAQSSASVLPQSDIYSLGVMFYEMLTGSVPFDDSHPMAVAMQHVSATPPSPRSINPKLNEATEEVLLKALDKSPSARYQTATEFVDALSKALAEGAEQFDKDALPPTPAMVQRREAGKEPSLPRLTVAERIHLHFEELAKQEKLAAEELAKQEILAAEALALTMVEHPTADESSEATLAEEVEAPPTSAESAPSDVAAPTPQPVPWMQQMTTGNGRFWLAGGVLAFIVLVAVLWGGGSGEANLPVPTAVPTTGGVGIVAAVDNTPTTTPSPTASATIPFTPTPSVTPTETPSPTATATLPPTVTPTPSETPTPTLSPTPTPTPSLILIYNRTGFYAYNATSQIINLTPLSFNAITSDSNPTQYVFQARTDWVFRQLPPNNCALIELPVPFLDVESIRPSRCADYSALTFPGEDSDQYFWARRPAEDIHQFRVSWQGETVQICQIIDGLCTVRLP